MDASEFFPRYEESNAYNVNEIIKQCRKIKHISQEDIAGEDFSTQTSVSRFENGKQTLRRLQNHIMDMILHTADVMYTTMG